VARTLFLQVSAAACATVLAAQVTRCRAAGLEAQLDRIGVQHRRCTDSIVPLAPAVTSIRSTAAGALGVVLQLRDFCFSGSSSSSGGEIKRALYVGRTCRALSEVVYRQSSRSAASVCHVTCGRREAAAGRIPITLGGDHSIAIGTLQGILRAHPAATIIWIDAHAGTHTQTLSNTPAAPDLMFHSHPWRYRHKHARHVAVRRSPSHPKPLSRHTLEPTASRFAGNAHGMPLAFLLGLINASTMCASRHVPPQRPQALSCRVQAGV
jgi:hypothetical protein